MKRLPSQLPDMPLPDDQDVLVVEKKSEGKLKGTKFGDLKTAITSALQGLVNALQTDKIPYQNADKPVNLNNQDLKGVKAFETTTIINYTESLVELIGGAIDLKDGVLFSHTVDDDIEYSFLNPQSGVAHSFTLILNVTGSYTIDFPAEVLWQYGVSPEFSTGKQYVLSFLTIDGGSNWFGFMGGEF